MVSDKTYFRATEERRRHGHVTETPTSAAGVVAERVTSEFIGDSLYDGGALGPVGSDDARRRLRVLLDIRELYLGSRRVYARLGAPQAGVGQFGDTGRSNDAMTDYEADTYQAWLNFTSRNRSAMAFLGPVCCDNALPRGATGARLREAVDVVR